MKRKKVFVFPILSLLSLIAFIPMASSARAQLSTGWKAHDLSRPEPPVVRPAPADNPGGPPSDAVILFDGKSLDKWQSSDGKQAKWKIVDGAMESVPGSGYVVTKDKFSDFQLHVEFATPAKVKGNGQGRGNSGVFLMGEIEIQVLDSYQNKTYPDGSAGSIYGQYPPLVNASRKPGEWQTYDIIFRAPKFDKDKKLITPAIVTVLHNGVLIQDHSEVIGPTAWIQHKTYVPGKTSGPISLQDHGNPVRYRNIWLRPLVPRAKNRTTAAPRFPFTIEQAEKLTGKYGNIPVTLEDGKLFLKFSGAKLEMVPISPTDFLFTKTAGKAVFRVDEKGRGTELELHLDAAGKRTAVRK